MRRMAAVGASTLIVLAALLPSVLTGCAAQPSSGGSTAKAAAEPNEIVARCMQEHGWDVTVGDDGGVASPLIPFGQATAYDTASADCWSRVKIPQFDDLGDDARRSLYRTVVKTRDCIVERGYELPKPPTYQAWADLSGRWSPYLDIDESLPEQEVDELLTACPIDIG